MIRLRPLLLALVVTPCAVLAETPTVENQRLRAQIEQLQAQLRAIEAQCPTAIAPIAAPAPSPAAVANPPAPAAASRDAAPVPASAPSPAAAAAPPPVNAPASAAVPSPPPGYKLVKIDPKQPPDLPVDARFRDIHNWEALTRGMSEPDVEDLLGTEHRTLTRNGRVQWSYGVAGLSPVGRVIFVDGRLAIWEQPNF